MKTAIERAEAYIAAEDAFKNASRATAVHVGLREHVPAAASAVKAFGWGAVAAWRSTAVFRISNKEGIGSTAADEHMGPTRLTAEAIIAAKKPINYDVPRMDEGSDMGRIERVLFCMFVEAPALGVGKLASLGMPGEHSINADVKPEVSDIPRVDK